MTTDRRISFVNFKLVEHSPWVATVAGVTYRPLLGKEPNAFHRMMQRLILGVKWERRP